MLTLINANLMKPPIAPVGLDYIACAALKAGIKTEILDLCLSDKPQQRLQEYFADHSPLLIGLSFRNVDDCFWPSGASFLPELKDIVTNIKASTDAPIVLGGVGYSIFPKEILQQTSAAFGIHGDGEQAVIAIYNTIKNTGTYENIPGLLWRSGSSVISNSPAWQTPLVLATTRDMIDNKTYFKKGGQIGIETKRGCNRNCIYCADPLAKGSALRLRNPKEIAEEIENLLTRQIDVFHICDAEFNIPYAHALAVCNELIRRTLGKKIRWYTYMAVTPFDEQLAAAMANAGCVGIDFTGDAGSGLMLKSYGQPHLPKDLDRAVELCRENEIKVMIDLLLGGPGETKQTLNDTIEFMKSVDPDCVGTGLGVRIYPGTQMERIVINDGDFEKNPNIKRKYTGPMNLLKPTFYISSLLGERPAKLVCELIAGDKRFFEPIDEFDPHMTDHNYNDNTELVKAIEKGARGAYWDILHQLRS